MSPTALEHAQQDLVLQAKHLLRQVQRGAAAWSAALLGESQYAQGGRQFGILMYHRVTEVVPGQPEPTWNVTPARMHKQLAGLLKRGFQAWPLRKVLEYRRRRWLLPRRTFVVTFDDGYANNLTQALPILAELKVPATIFLATAYLGKSEPFPFDDWGAKGSDAVPSDAWWPLTLDQCRELQASGLIELAAHTHTHQDFRGRLDDFRNDLRQCREFLRDELGIFESTFAFPYGSKKLGFSGVELARVVRELGFECGLTSDGELARIDEDRFDWGRFQVDQGDSAGVLAGKLSGWFGWLRDSGRNLVSLLHSRNSSGAAGEPFGSAPLRLGRFR
jgi:peptidoglycan/xylan/chitin deacetylase (PgdA/CDA1 family)